MANLHLLFGSALAGVNISNVTVKASNVRDMINQQQREIKSRIEIFALIVPD